jgi:hypothetical protein
LKRLERLAVDPLHRDVGRLPLAPEFMDGGDAGVAEARGDLRLPLEPRDVLRRVVQEQLDGDGAAERRVPRLPHFAHAAAAEEMQKGVPPDPHRGHARSLHRPPPDMIVRRSTATPSSTRFFSSSGECARTH